MKSRNFDFGKQSVSRRSMLKGMTAASMAGLAAGTFNASSASQKAQKPNFLFIAIDDLNDYTGFLAGHPQTKTPNMDALAAQSVIFERSYCAFPVCCGSRTAMLTGIPPYRSGIYGNTENFRDDMSLIKDCVSLPQYMSKNGYVSMNQGKVFHHHNKPFDYLKEWDYWAKPELPACAGDDAAFADNPLNGIANIEKGFDWGPTTCNDTKQTGDYLNAEWAAAQLQKTHDKPFFIACGIYRPHLPWYIPQKYFDMFPLESIELPPIKDDDLEDVPWASPKADYLTIKEAGKRKDVVRAYLASIAFADDCVGKLLEGLNASPHKDNTIVILWGDHGWHLGEKLHYGKTKLWEESTRQPLLIKVPGKAGMGKRCSRVVSLMDVFPTITELAGLPDNVPVVAPSNGEVYGRSLVPLLDNPDKEWPYPAVTTYHACLNCYPNFSVRNERYHYIITYKNDKSVKGEELYDHSNDPQEWTNLAGKAEYASVVAEMKQYVPQNAATRLDAVTGVTFGGPSPTRYDYRMDQVRTKGSGQVMVDISLPEKSYVLVDIYTAAGSRVARLGGNAESKGTHRFVWDGRCRNGNRAARGQAYIIAVRADTGTEDAFTAYDRVVW